MYKEMDENGQYQLDCRLNSERNLEENVNVMIAFVCDLRKQEIGEKRIRNRHEGYGFLADAYLTVNFAMKKVKDGMNDLLQTLPIPDDSAAVDKVESLTNALTDAIVAIATMAAEGRRVSGDLFKENWNPSTGDDEGFMEPEAE